MDEYIGMMSSDLYILKQLSGGMRLRIVRLLQSAGLYPAEGAPTRFHRVGTMMDYLNDYSITMADILHLLIRDSKTSARSTAILRELVPLLLQNTPALLDESMPPELRRTVVGVYQHLLSDPDSAIYHPGQSVADLHLILGIPMWEILDNVARGALVLTPTPSYANPLDLAMEDLSG